MKTDLTYVSDELKKKKLPRAIPAAHSGELTVQEFENAFVAPFINFSVSLGGVITKCKNAVDDNEKKCDTSKYDFSKIDIEHKTIIYIGYIDNCFGHYFTDALRKLWFLSTDDGREMTTQGVEVVYVGMSPLQKVALEIFRLAGINTDTFRHIDKLTLFDTIVVPENCFCHLPQTKAYPYHIAWGQMIDRIINNAISYPQKEAKSHIYLTRTLLKKNMREYGEANILRVFEKRGYTVVAPERLSIYEQIRLMHNCKQLVVTEGSISHLSLFCRPETEVVILCKANYRNGYQELINNYANLNVTYIEAHRSTKADKNEPWCGPFYLCVNKYLERYIGHPIPHLPYWILPSYWRYSKNIIYRLGSKMIKQIKVRDN